MDHNKKRLILPGALAACLLLALLVGGTLFSRYLKAQIAEERTTQLLEITAQVRVNLSNALDAHWTYITAAVNLLEQVSIPSGEAAPEAVGSWSASWAWTATPPPC